MPIRPVVRSSLLGRPLLISSGSGAVGAGAGAAAAASCRTFAASSQSRAAQNPLISADLPPESPNFIKYPEPPQSERVYRAPKRGHLPVPRNVFKVDRKPGQPPRTDPSVVPKTKTDVFAARATPLSKAEQAGEPPRSAKETWRRRMAAARRENLQSGLGGLWTRQQTETKRARARSAYNFERNRAAAMGDATTERDDVRLTQSSVRDVTAKETAVVRDPLRHERQAEMAARTAALAQAKREARRDALMELYQIAGKFIVDEKDLEQRVNELFHPDYFKQEGYKFGMINADSVWDVNGRPPSIAQQMSAVTRTETRLYDAHMSESDRTTKRQKLVTEALTGGKMP